MAADYGDQIYSGACRQQQLITSRTRDSKTCQFIELYSCWCFVPKLVPFPDHEKLDFVGDNGHKTHNSPMGISGVVYYIMIVIYKNTLVGTGNRSHMRTCMSRSITKYIDCFLPKTFLSKDRQGKAQNKTLTIWALQY